jgi:pimeloyl-ACP methyl ester carboxylesterase
MNENRIHRAVSADGTQIVARVHGQGPPLVFLPAGPGDSETSWGILLPFLSDRFTCYLMNTRGRGLSADHPDYSPQRLVEDVVAFAESIGEPVGLTGWGTTLLALVAAEGTTAVSAVAAYESAADEVASEEIRARLGDVFARVGELAAEGRLVDAARSFIEHSTVIYTDEEVTSGAPWAFWQTSAPNILVFLQEEQQAAASERPGPTDPAVLARITVLVLLLHGSESRPWFTGSVRHVASRVADPHVRAISGAGHFGPHTKPEAVASELIGFFSSALQPARRAA